MADMIQVIRQACMAIKERPRNFIYSALWSFAFSMVFLAIFMAFYFMFVLTSLTAAVSANPAAVDLSGMVGAIALMYGFVILMAVFSAPLQTVANMLYAKGSLEGKDIGLGDYIASLKDKYVRLFLANILVGIVSLLILVLLCLVLGGIGYAIYLLAGKALSSILFAIMALVAIAVFFAVMVAVSLLTMLYIPYVFSKQKLDRGLIGSFMHSVELAKARAWDILAYMLVMLVVYVAFVIVSIIIGMIPCIGYISTLFTMVIGFAINFASAYVLLYLVKDAS